MATVSRGYYKRKTASGFEIVYLYSDATAIAETDTRKFVTPTEKTTWNAKIGGVKVNGTALSVDSNNVVNIDLSKYALASHTHNSVKWLQQSVSNGDGTEDTIYLNLLASGTAQLKVVTPNVEVVKTLATTDHNHDTRYPVLDSNNLIPSKYIPGAYDDVLEYSAYSSLPSTGETGKLYVTTGDNKVYRWSGSTYIQVNGGLVLGTTADTAAAGNHNHDSVYAKLSHNHDSTYAKLGHNHDCVKYLQKSVGSTDTMYLEMNDDKTVQMRYKTPNDELTKVLATTDHNHNGTYARIFYGSTEPTDAVEGDIWISTAV